MNEKPINPLQYGYYKEEMETHCQSLQLFYQQEARHRVGHWSDANVKLLSPQTDVQAEIRTYHVPNITCGTPNAKTMRTVTLKMLIALMKLMGCKAMKLLVCNLQKVSI